MTLKEQAEKIATDDEVVKIRDRVNLNDADSVFAYLELLVKKGVLEKVEYSDRPPAYHRTKVGRYYFRLMVNLGL